MSEPGLPVLVCNERKSSARPPACPPATHTRARAGTQRSLAPSTSPAGARRDGQSSTRRRARSHSCKRHHPHLLSGGRAGRPRDLRGTHLRSRSVLGAPRLRPMPGGCIGDSLPRKSSGTAPRVPCDRSRRGLRARHFSRAPQVWRHSRRRRRRWARWSGDVRPSRRVASRRGASLDVVAREIAVVFAHTPLCCDGVVRICALVFRLVL